MTDRETMLFLFCFLFVLLDLSSAFDVIDHIFFLKRLHSEVCLGSTVLLSLVFMIFKKKKKKKNDEKRNVA